MANKIKSPKKLDMDNGDSYEKSISITHLDDENKCHIMVMSWGELASMSLNKTQAKRLSNWLNKWIAYKDAFVSGGDE